jgi:hypothetical protein
MVFTQHVTDGTGGFLELGAGVQPQFGHRIDDAALNGLQAIPINGNALSMMTYME